MPTCDGYYICRYLDQSPATVGDELFKKIIWNGSNWLDYDENDSICKLNITHFTIPGAIEIE